MKTNIPVDLYSRLLQTLLQSRQEFWGADGRFVGEKISRAKGGRVVQSRFVFLNPVGIDFVQFNTVDLPLLERRC